MKYLLSSFLDWTFPRTFCFTENPRHTHPHKFQEPFSVCVCESQRRRRRHLNFNAYFTVFFGAAAGWFWVDFTCEDAKIVFGGVVRCGLLMRERVQCVCVCVFTFRWDFAPRYAQPSETRGHKCSAYIKPEKICFQSFLQVITVANAVNVRIKESKLWKHPYHSSYNTFNYLQGLKFDKYFKNIVRLTHFANEIQDFILKKTITLHIPMSMENEQNTVFYYVNHKIIKSIDFFDLFLASHCQISSLQDHIYPCRHFRLLFIPNKSTLIAT